MSNFACDVVDFHAHMDNSPLRLQELFEVQKRAGIKTTVVVSGNLLDASRLGDYLRGGHPLDEYEPNNMYLLQLHQSNPERLLAFFTVDPGYHETYDILDAINAGYKGFKFNPLVHKVDFRDPDLQEIYALLDLHKQPLYTHITLNPAASLEAIAEISQKFRDIRFVVGHMGYATCDQGALQLANARPNVYLETSVSSMLALRMAQRYGLSHKLIYGSEFPGHDPEVELKKLQLIFSDAELQRICRLNALDLIGLKHV